MSWLPSNDQYTPLKRRLRNTEPLTPEQVKYILENPYNTGYTYAKRSSSDGNFITRTFWFIISVFTSFIIDLINTNGIMIRQLFSDIEHSFWKLLGYQYDDSLEEHEYQEDAGYEETRTYNLRSRRVEHHEQHLERKSFFKRVLDTLLYVVTFGNYPENYHGILAAHPGQDKKGSIIPFLLGLGGLLLLLLLLFRAPHNLDESESSPLINWDSIASPVSRGYDIVSYPFGYGWNATKSVLSHAGPFANFVSNDVKDLGSSIASNGFNVITYPLVYGWNTTKNIISHAHPLANVKDVGSSIVSNGFNIISYPIVYGWNSTKALFSHARPFADFVSDDVKNLTHSVAEGGDTVYHWFTSFLYWIVSQIVFVFIWAWHWFIAILRFPFLILSNLYHSMISVDKTLPRPPTIHESQSFSPPASAPPSINEDQYASKFSQWEMELDKIRKEIRSIGAVSQETSDAKTSALIDTQMRRVEMFINSLFEKEREMLRMEKEQLKKAAEDRSKEKAVDQAPIQEHHHHHTNVHVSEEEVAELVQRSLRNVNLTSMVEEVVRYYIQNHFSETERHSTVNINELVEKKIYTTIYETLRRFSYDKTGEPDFALESAGGSVISTRCTEDWSQHSRREKIWGIPLWYTAYSPRSVIQRQSQNVNAGECWAVKGAEAYLVIKLARNIDVTAVSYEHLPRELAISGNLDSAPKNFKIYSLQEENDPNKFLIGEYIYDDNGEPLQRFDAQHHDPRGTPFIEFELHSNYGAAFTCLYRFRVHGNPL